MAVKDGIKIGKDFRTSFNKSYYMAWDKRDGHMIRYLVNHGFYKARFEPICRYCGDDNSRTHVTNVCPEFEKLRRDTWVELGED